MNTQPNLRLRTIAAMSTLADDIFNNCQKNDFEEIVNRETVDYFLRVGMQFNFHIHDIGCKIAVNQRFIATNPDSETVSACHASIAEFEHELVELKALVKKLDSYAIALTARKKLH